MGPRHRRCPRDQNRHADQAGDRGKEIQLAQCTSSQVALTGGALAIAASARQGDQSRAALLIVGRVALGAFLIASGVQHFLFPDAVTTLVPTWIPGARMWTYVAGVALIAGGVGLIVPQTTRIAGMSVGLMLFTWVCILHIPRALTAPPANQRNEWTAVFEALAFAGIALTLAQQIAPSKDLRQ